MRIGIDARMYGAKATTGIGVYTKNLIEHLLKIDKKNQYVLFMSASGFKEFTDSRVEKVLVKSHWYSWAEQLEMPRVLLKHKLDLIHFPHFNVPILYPKKFVVTIHDLTPLFFPGPRVKKSIIRKIGYHQVIRSAVKKSRKIITVSQFTKENIVKNLKVSPEKIKLTYLGYNDQVFKNTSNFDFSNLKNKYKITKDFIFYLGVLRDHKNIPSLIASFNQLKENYDLQLVLGGSLDDRFPEVRQAIESSPAHQDIIVTGFIPDEDLPLMYNAAKLFVLPSFSEGFGLVAIESAACGTPVIAANNSCLPEILEDAGIYFDPQNIKEITKTITRVLTDNELYRGLQERGLEQVKKYSWDQCAQATLDIYESV